MLKEYWKKTRMYITALITQNKREESHNDAYKIDTEQSRMIQLEPAIYAEMEKLAQQEKTTTSVILYRALEFYKSRKVVEGEWKINLERKERNPILLLDGIAFLDQEQHKQLGEEESIDESQSFVNW